MARRTRARTPPPERPADHSHSLRERKPPAGTYVVSDDSDESDDELRPSQGYKDGGDAASSSEEEEEESEPEPEPEVPRERSSAGGRSLRAAASLKPPSGLADMVSTDKALTTRKKSKRKSKSRAKAKPRPKAKQTKKGEDEGELTVRGEIRQALEETKKRREAFFLKNRELFENLLPESNYISKLADKELELPEPVEYKLLEKQPEHVKATMKSYQLSGLSFLVWLYNNGSNGILGDEMGLGKTLQTLSLFSYLSTYKPEPHHRPFLVVCPLSVVSSWMAEAKKWVPHLKCLRFHGPASERNRLKQVAETGEVIGFDDSETADDPDAEPRGYDIIVTSYEVFEREKQWFRRAFVWRYVVLDEGHKIKNDKTNISQALQGLSAEFRLILTGTPLQNNLTELWALLHWLFPDVFQENTSKLFTDAFDLTNGKNNLEVLDNSRKLLELIMLRRMKESKGVNLGLPPKTELIMFLPLTPMQRFWYKRLLTRLDKGLLEGLYADSKDKTVADVKEDPDALGHMVDDNDLEKMDKMLENTDEWGETKQMMEKAVKESKGDGKWQKLMNLLMQLRKCCNHPFLLPNAEPDDDDQETRASSLILASSKFIFLDKLIQELCIKQKKKVLIFSGFTKMLDVCEDFLEMKSVNNTKFKFGRLDGTTARARRNLAIRLFNNDPDYKVMLISTRAGGLGLNLASASEVVMLESDWNPQADLQAQARAHRIGQVNPVTIYRLITQGTVEEQMMGRIRKKLYLSAKVTESMRDIHTSTSGSANLNKTSDEDGPTLSTSQLMSLVRSGSRAIAHPEIDPADMLKWDWETTTRKCHEYAEKLAADAAAITSTSNPDSDAQAEAEWLSQMERVESRVFEGKAHSTAATSTNTAIAEDWSREQRRHGMNRVVMIDGHPVLKETIGNNEWEAVKTFSGRDPSLRGPEKRKRAKIEHQDYCQVCFDGGEVVACAGCPRVYHPDCLSDNMRAKLDTRQNQFYCQQHECIECEQKTTNAGGLIYRCRWCEAGYCEDCLDWNKTQLLGDQLLEYELLEFPQHSQAYYIKCVNCIARHKEDKQARELCADFEMQWKVQKESKDLQEAQEAERAEKDAEQRRLESVNPAKMEIDDTPGLVGSEFKTVDSSEVSTPASFAGLDGGSEGKGKRKRKASMPQAQKVQKVQKVKKEGTATPRGRGSRESTVASAGKGGKKQKVLMVVNGQLMTGAGPGEE